MINSLGNLGGYYGPVIVGNISTKFHSTGMAMVVLAGLLSGYPHIINIAFFRNHPRKSDPA